MDSPRHSDRPAFAAVIVAAGQGMRAGQPVPKQFAPWRGKPLLRHSVEALSAAGADPIVVAIQENGEALAREALAGIGKIAFAAGGTTRQLSAKAALDAMSGRAPDLVLIHDAARPIVPTAVVDRLLEALRDRPGAIPVLPVVDSLAQDANGVMAGTAPRESLRRVQTPQAFRYADILAAHRSWVGDAIAGDDAQVAMAAGLAVALVPGDEAMRKMTYSEDFNGELPPVRTGTGYDVHRLAEGEELWLCGIRIEHDKGLSGHSDADVAIHALVDALLGAAGAGDIGEHFSPRDPRWKGASSDRFLSHAVALVGEAGYRVGNIDLTIVCEEPKIGPYRAAMRERLAELLGIAIGLVSVKATTTERLGFAGRGEGIAAQAVATILHND